MQTRRKYFQKYSIAWALLLFGATQGDANVVYEYHDVYGPTLAYFDIPVHGTITTNGKLGTLSASDILSWNVDIDSPFVPMILSGPSTNSTITLFGAGLLATEAGLFFDFTGASEFALGFNDNIQGNIAGFIDYGGTRFIVGTYVVCDCDILWASETRFGVQQIADATPLPAALPLFLTGLGALGLLGWYRKRPFAR